MNSANPVRFSEYFQIDKAKLDELGVFDPILNYDTKVFVEPLLLKDSSNEIIKNSYQNYKQFFANLLLLLQKSKEHDDKCWRAAKKMVCFPEYQYTCIGYGSGSTEGRGSGTEFNDRILQSAKEIVDLAEGNPEIFLLLPLLEDGIAGDRISDMVQNIIDDDICLYTRDVMDKLGLKGNCLYTTKNHKTYSLLRNPYSNLPIKLIPKDILLNLPVADNIDSLVEEMTAHNQRLREVISRDIGNIWLETTKAYRKGVLLKELKTNKEFFVETLKALKEYQIEHYDLDKDYEGLYRWLANSEAFINTELSTETASCPDNLAALDCAIVEIIRHFRDIIENQEVWRMFWTQEGGEYRHVREYYSQMLFFTVCNAWLTAQNSNIKVSLEHEGSTINLKFSISNQCQVVVHIKHANNSKLYDGYRAILEKRRNVEGKQHYYLVMNFKEEEAAQLKEIKVIANPICQLFEINVTKQIPKQQEASEWADVKIDWSDPGYGEVLLEFEGMAPQDMRYIQEKRKGGQNRHKKTDTIKHNIVRIMFAQRKLIKGISIKQRARNLSDKLSQLQGMNNDELSAFSKQYGLDFNTVKQSIGYFADDKEEQIYKWCLDIEKEVA